ncbi:hypothetical protein D1832_06680 [Dermacoccus abyssi]|uniref:Uncharacterized protein n=1 Tax=Dermacoccus abyssi TaxID=322596 RepID=A0A417Z6B9_9MICO|nr:hypothetical protein D1832_06680 [Dermacoccus abyssi]
MATKFLNDDIWQVRNGAAAIRELRRDALHMLLCEDRNSDRTAAERYVTIIVPFQLVLVQAIAGGIGYTIRDLPKVWFPCIHRDQTEPPAGRLSVVA